jgi:hypothetical protein
VSLQRATALLAPLAATSGAAASFVLTTVVMDTMPDTVLVGLSALVAFLAVMAYYRIDLIALVRESDRAALLWAAGGGLLAFWAAPLLALSQRASDAPSGADALFMTTTAWGLAAVVVAFAVRDGRPSLTALAGALASAAGTAGLLASWERPSSFSPFAKFPTREGLMLLAGGLFALGAFGLARAARRAGPRFAALLGLAGAAAAGVLISSPALPSMFAERASLSATVYLGAFVALFAIGIVHTVADAGVSRASVALLGVPLAVMVFSLWEQFRAVYGPSPVAWPSAMAGVGVLTTGAITVWLAEKPARDSLVTIKAAALPLAVAAAAAVLGVVQLATPALGALAEGGTGQPFRASWTMVGAEAASGWLVLAAALLSLSAAVAWWRGRPLATWGSAAVTALLCGGAAIPLSGTTLHTWNRWVPADVQQTYGTEYSRLVIEAQTDPVRLAAMALTALAVVALSVLAWRLRAVERDLQGGRQ